MDSHQQIQQDFKKIIKGMIIGNLLFLPVGFFLIEEGAAYITGLLFGSIIAVLNLRLLYLTLKKAVTMPYRQAQVFTVIRYILRYIIVGIVVYGSIIADHIHPLGTIIGLLLMKPVVLITQLGEDREFLRKIFRR